MHGGRALARKPEWATNTYMCPRGGEGGNMFEVTKKGPFHVEGYRLVEVEGELVREFYIIPRNFMGRLLDWFEDVEAIHPGPFWGTLTIFCLAALAYGGWLLYMLEPWTYGWRHIDTIIVAIYGAVCVVVTFLVGWTWIAMAIVPWVRLRMWRR